MTKKKILVNTGGGDAPGLNAVIRAVTLSAIQQGWEVWGIREGYRGILAPEAFPNGGLVRLDAQAVRGITHLGGTILGTTNRGNPLSFPIQNEDGEWVEIDRCDELTNFFTENDFDTLVAIGGDGSLAIADEIGRRSGISVIGVPKTIDNDLEGTIATFGFDTAIDFAADCIGRLHTTAASHNRIMVVEVMGRYAGWIALFAGLAATADVILIPEIPFDIDIVAGKCNDRVAQGRNFSIVVVGEGAKPVGGEVSTIGKSVGQAVRLGGVGHQISHALGEMTGQETRCVVLGHLLRGGTPTTRDRLLALRFGAAAVRAIEEGQRNVMVALKPPTISYIPLSDIAGKMKLVPIEGDAIKTARSMGICLGD